MCTLEVKSSPTVAGPIIAGEHPRAEAIFFVLFVGCLLIFGFRKELAEQHPWFKWLFTHARHMLHPH